MVSCENCENEHDGSYGSGRFCCEKCSRSFSTKYNRLETNKKVSLSLKGRGNPDITKNCINCGIEFTRRYVKRHQKACSKSCGARNFAQTDDGKKHFIKMGTKSAKSQNKRSKNEVEFANLCLQHFKNIECNNSIFNGWDADIIIHDLKMAILWNGKWHYEKITEKHSLIQVQNRDRIKIKEITKFGYEPYIIKDLGRYNIKFVKEQFDIFLKYINGQYIIAA